MSRYRKSMRQAIEEGLSNMQIAILKKEYAPFKGKTINAARAKQLMNILDKFKDDDLKKLSKANIPFVSSGSASKLAVRNMGVKVTTFNPMGGFKEEITQEDFDLEEGKMKTIATMFDAGKSAEEIAKAMKLSVATVKSILGEVNEQLSMKATFKNGDDKTFKGKTASDINKQVKEYEKKHKTGLQHDGPMVKEGKNMKEHPAKAVYEQIKGLKNKAEKSGMPYSILKKVYDRGMAAWRGGHRPGTTQQQWAFARVNSFVTKSSGTWGGADKDLAAKVRGSK